MRTCTDIIGKPIISVDNGTNVGVVKDLYFNQSLNALAGIFLGSEGLIKRKTRFIDAKDVVVLGTDAILISRADATEDSESSIVHKEWVRRERLIGRAIKTAGETLVGSVGDIYLGSLGQVKALALAKVQIESPVASAGLIMRDALLEVGDDDTSMIVDLAIAERQSRDSLHEANSVYQGESP